MPSIIQKFSNIKFSRYIPKACGSDCITYFNWIRLKCSIFIIPFHYVSLDASGQTISHCQCPSCFKTIYDGWKHLYDHIHSGTSASGIQIVHFLWLENVICKCKNFFHEYLYINSHTFIYWASYDNQHPQYQKENSTSLFTIILVPLDRLHDRN